MSWLGMDDESFTGPIETGERCEICHSKMCKECGTYWCTNPHCESITGDADEIAEWFVKNNKDLTYDTDSDEWVRVRKCSR